MYMLHLKDARFIFYNIAVLSRVRTEPYEMCDAQIQIQITENAVVVEIPW